MHTPPGTSFLMVDTGRPQPGFLTTHGWWAIASNALKTSKVRALRMSVRDLDLEATEAQFLQRPGMGTQAQHVPSNLSLD
jgi:hypothetical protein